MNKIIAHSQDTSRSWGQAYKAFLLSPDESFLLKIAPIAIALGAPELIAATIIPVIGELTDLGGFGLTALVVIRTLVAVNKYR